MKILLKPALIMLTAALTAGLVSCKSGGGTSDPKDTAALDNLPGSSDTGGAQHDDYTVNLPGAIDFSTYQVPVLEKDSNGLYVQIFKPYKI